MFNEELRRTSLPQKNPQAKHFKAYVICGGKILISNFSS
jgi:hypothetical protein